MNGGFSRDNQRELLAVFEVFQNDFLTVNFFDPAQEGFFFSFGGLGDQDNPFGDDFFRSFTVAHGDGVMADFQVVKFDGLSFFVNDRNILVGLGGFFALRGLKNDGLVKKIGDLAKKSLFFTLRNGGFAGGFLFQFFFDLVGFRVGTGGAGLLGAGERPEAKNE